MSKDIKKIIVIVLFMVVGYSFFSGQIVLGAESLGKLAVTKGVSRRIVDIYNSYLNNKLLLIVSIILFVANLMFLTFFIKLYRAYKKNRDGKKKIARELKDKNFLLENIDMHIWTFKNEDTYGMANKTHANFMNKSEEELKDKSIYNIYTEKETETVIKYNKKVFKEKIETHTEEIFKDKDGQDRILSITRTPRIGKRGKVEYLICSASDITELRVMEEKVKDMTYHDSLTGLFNRGYYEYILPKIDREERLPLSIIAADLNGLKLANDVFGHDAGDTLLKASAEILQDSIREQDILIRWGGDEFCIFMPNTGIEESQKIVERILSNCWENDLAPFPPNIAVGSATRYSLRDRIEDIFNKAENRMYIRKSEEKNKISNPILLSLIDRFLDNDYEEEGHLGRVRELSFKFAQKLGLSENLIHRLFLLAEFHDIGRLATSLRSLHNSEGIKKIDKHIEAGYNIAKNFKILNPISELILYHHENWNGSGYPSGLKGEEIPILSRVLRIIHTYDIMVNGRDYKEPVSVEEAIKTLKDGAGIKYDPSLVDSFIELIKEDEI